jgi:hypothetical protein
MLRSPHYGRGPNHSLEGGVEHSRSIGQIVRERFPIVNGIRRRAQARSPLPEKDLVGSVGGATDVPQTFRDGGERLARRHAAS